VKGLDKGVYQNISRLQSALTGERTIYAQIN
jgi:hypothetical protein